MYLVSSKLLLCIFQALPNYIFPIIRTEVLKNGFKHELQGRLDTLKANRVELERLYALRVSDEQIDDPENNKYKEDSMKAIRNCEASFTSYTGSVKSIKSVLEPRLHEQPILIGLWFMQVCFPCRKWKNLKLLTSNLNQQRTIGLS